MRLRVGTRAPQCTVAACCICWLLAPDGSWVRGVGTSHGSAIVEAIGACRCRLKIAVQANVKPEGSPAAAPSPPSRAPALAPVSGGLGTSQWRQWHQSAALAPVSGLGTSQWRGCRGAGSALLLSVLPSTPWMHAPARWPLARGSILAGLCRCWPDPLAGPRRWKVRCTDSPLV